MKKKKNKIEYLNASDTMKKWKELYNEEIEAEEQKRADEIATEEYHKNKQDESGFKINTPQESD